MSAHSCRSKCDCSPKMCSQQHNSAARQACTSAFKLCALASVHRGGHASCTSVLLQSRQLHFTVLLQSRKVHFTVLWQSRQLCFTVLLPAEESPSHLHAVGAHLAVSQLRS